MGHGPRTLYTFISPGIALGAAALAACGFPKPADVAECVTASDCKSPTAPFCVAGSCVAACRANADCAGLAATPFCQTSSGMCVACLDAGVCSADKPVCDATAGACRGCAADPECPGGVCIEAEGTCAADRDFAFVDGRSGSDLGACTRSAPCKTLAFALSVAPATPHGIQIKVLSPELLLPGTVNLVNQLYLEGSNTTITGSGGATGMFKLQGVSATLSHVNLLPASGQPVTAVDGTQVLRLFDVQAGGAINVNQGGDLDADQTTFTNGGGVACTGGTVTVRRSAFEQSPLGTMTCTVIVRRTRFDLQGDGNIFFGGGTLTFENNLIVQAIGIGDAMTVSGQVPPGRTVRFNTFVSTDAPSDGNALGCTAPVDVSSNIFAYNSMHPNSMECGVRYSLYDGVALPQFATGVGVTQGDRNTFFVDLAGKDFHLSASSPARSTAEPGVGVSEDFDGKVRPDPAGSARDRGAFEAP